MRVRVDPALPLLQTTPWVLVGHWALHLELVARHKASLPCAADDQAQWAQQPAIIPFIPKPPKMAMFRAASLIPPKVRKSMLRKRTMLRQVRVRSRPQVMSRRHPRVKISRSAHTPRTLSPVLVSSSASTRTPTQSPTLGRKSRWQKQCKDSPKEDSPKKDSSGSLSSEEELPTDEVLQDEARQKLQLLDTHFGAWHCDKITNNVMDWVMRDTMICDLPKHGKTQPNHPDPVEPPLDYMAKCKVFDCIQMNLYDLCCFYALGTTSNPPDFPSPWEPVMHSQVRDLLNLARSVGRPDMILVHSANSVITLSMLQDLHMATYLRCLQTDHREKSVKMSFCPFCTFVAMNDLSYLNHIIIAHYNASYGCEKCFKQAFMSSSALHNHKKVCLRFDKKSMTGYDSKPSSGSGGNNSQGGGSMRATPKKQASKAPAANSQGSSTPTASQTTPHHSGCNKSHCFKPHKDLKSNKKKKGHASPTRKGSGHKSHKHSSQH